MTYAQDVKRAWNLLWQPGTESKKSMDISSALKFYYKIGILGLIAFLVVGTLLISAGIVPSGYRAIMSQFVNVAYFSFAVLFTGAVLYFLILIPISIAINALIIQAIGKYLLNSWRGDYSKTFAAETLSYSPILLFSWLMLMPILRSLFFIFVIWQAVILIIAIATQQKVSRTNAFVALLATWILVAAFVVLFLMFTSTALLPFFPLPVNSSITVLPAIPYR